MLAAGGRVNRHAFGLVYNDDLIVFEENVERDVLGADNARLGIGYIGR